MKSGLHAKIFRISTSPPCKPDFALVYMSVLNLSLPKSLHKQLKELAQEEGISVKEFVMLAVAEKVASISTIEYLEKRAKRGSREKLLAVLNKVPDVEPEAFDRL